MPLPQGLQPDDIQRNEFLIGEGTQQFSKVKTGWLLKMTLDFISTSGAMYTMPFTWVLLNLYIHLDPIIQA